MAKHSDTPLKDFLARERVSQADLARGIKKTTAFVSLLANEETGASKDTIDDILAFLSTLLRRRVTYEEVWGVPSTEPTPVRTAGGR